MNNPYTVAEIILYHKSCPDGVLAATFYLLSHKPHPFKSFINEHTIQLNGKPEKIVAKSLEFDEAGNYDEMRIAFLVPADYSWTEQTYQELYRQLNELYPYVDRWNVVAVDYTPVDLIATNDEDREWCNHIEVYDHHITSLEKIERISEKKGLIKSNDPDFEGMIHFDGERESIVFDLDYCGTYIVAFQFGIIEDGYDDVARLIDDRDLWKHKYKESSWFSYGLRSLYDLTDPSTIIQLWYDLQVNPVIFLDNVLQIGKNVQMWIEKSVIRHLKHAHRALFVKKDPTYGYTMYAVNAAELQSEIGHAMLESGEYGDPVAIYHVNSRGKYSVSLRSKTGKAREVAEQFGGGGHPNAAGFECNSIIL